MAANTQAIFGSSSRAELLFLLSSKILGQPIFSNKRTRPLRFFQSKGRLIEIRHTTRNNGIGGRDKFIFGLPKMPHNSSPPETPPKDHLQNPE